MAGGKSSRMNGVNKGLIRYEGKTFMERAAIALADCDRVYVSVNNYNLDYKTDFYDYANNQAINQNKKFKKFKKFVETPDKFFFENFSGFIYDKKNIGPLGGISAALNFLDDDALFIPCDMPFITREYTAKLICDYNENRQPVFLGENGEPNPLAGIYVAACLPVIRKAVSEKNYKVSSILKRIEPRVVSVPANILRNINTPEDIRSFLNNQKFSQ